MNIFDYAMNLEKEGEKIYRKLAGKASNKGEKTILSWLADQEARHYRILAEINASTDLREDEAVSLNDILSVFDEWKQKRNSFYSSPQVKLYRKALSVEEKSIKYYKQKANEAENERFREILLRIADEEEKHWQLLDNIIEHIRKPEHWTESPEFTHTGEQY